MSGGRGGSRENPDPGSQGEVLERFIARHGWRTYDYRFDGFGHLFFVEPPNDTGEGFEVLRLALKARPGRRYNPLLRELGGELALVLVPHPPRDTRSRRLNLILLLATIFTTTWAGTFFYAGYSGEYEFTSSWDMLLILLQPRILFMGWLTFSLPLMTILGCHEMGHYFYARKHNLDASLPFFIPMPPPLILGTMGAFIAIREPIPNRKALLDVGASGPIAGFLVALPVTLFGFWLTDWAARPVPVDPGDAIFLGTPLVFDLLALLYASLSPFSGDYLIHPVAFAGWVGFLVTALNLLPAGQLDGGHIARALLGPQARLLSYTVMGVMLFLALFGIPGYAAPYFGWAIFAALVYFLGTVHPPPSDELSPLDTRRKLVGAFTVLMLVGTFIPSPMIMGESPFELEFGAQPDEFVNLAGGSNTTAVWVNNTGGGGGWDNLTLQLALPEGWNGSLAVLAVHRGKETWGTFHANFSAFASRADPHNATLNLSTGAGANLTVTVEIPEDVAPGAYTPQLLVTSRTGREYRLKLPTTVVAWELEVEAGALAGAAGTNLTATLRLNHTGEGSQNVTLTLALPANWSGELDGQNLTLALELVGEPITIEVRVQAPVATPAGAYELELRLRDGRSLERTLPLSVTLEAA